MQSMNSWSRKNSKQWLCFFALILASACQPLSRQDRATVGPELTPTVAAGQQNPSDPSTQDATGDSASNGTGGIFASYSVSTQWEASMHSQCDLGKPAACSSLAYEASRTQRMAVAAELFKRACLMDQSPAQCSAAGSDSKGSARSCLELSALLQQQGQGEEARKFRLCACERNYKPACVPL